MTGYWNLAFTAKFRRRVSLFRRAYFGNNNSLRFSRFVIIKVLDTTELRAVMGVRECALTTLTAGQSPDVLLENTARNNSFFIANYHNSCNTVSREPGIRRNVFRAHPSPRTSSSPQRERKKGTPWQVPSDIRIIFVYQRHRNDRARRNYNGFGRWYTTCGSRPTLSRWNGFDNLRVAVPRVSGIKLR